MYFMHKKRMLPYILVTFLSVKAPRAYIERAKSIIFY